MSGLIWKKSKSGNWYLAIEQQWQGDMTGRIKFFYPAHNCDAQVVSNNKKIDDLRIEIAELQELVAYLVSHPDSTVPGYLRKMQEKLQMQEAELGRLTA